MNDDALALRLSYVLSRAALAEAFTDIDLQNERSRALVVQTHLLGKLITVIQNGHNQLKRVASEDMLKPFQLKKVRQAEHALEKFDSLAFVSRQFQKVREGAQALAPTLRLETERIEEHLKRTIGECWDFARNLKNQDVADPDIVCQLDDIQTLQTDDRYLRIAFLEVCTNILEHGDSLTSDRPIFTFAPTPGSNDILIWCEVSNAVSQDPKDLAELRQTLKMNRGLMGLASLCYAAAAWKLPPPDMGPNSR